MSRTSWRALAAVLLLGFMVAGCGGGGGGASPDVGGPPPDPPPPDPPPPDPPPPDPPPDPDPPVTLVATQEGEVNGIEENGSIAFKGIPYAAPPLADARWQPPRAVDPWQDVLDASTFGARCIQPFIGGPEDAGERADEAVGAEDCLYLNVWTPADRDDAARLPVMLFIHGGTNLSGSGNETIDHILNIDSGPTWYDGSRVAARGDLVVVTVNYRLGALGFLAHSGMLPGSDTGSVGNYGIMDQIAALQWVQRNIAAFGGDPARVMIVGQSAGGYDVCTLLVSPRAAGLFSRAVMHSGSCAIHGAERAQNSAEDLVAEMACDAAPDLRACMETIPAETLALAESAVPNGVGDFKIYVSVDGYVVSDKPLNLILQGAHNHVPYMVGSNSEEYYSRFSGIPDVLYPAFVEQLAGEENRDLVLGFYPLSDFNNASQALATVYADRNINCPARLYARSVEANQVSPVYRYFFKRMLSAPERLADGAYHSSELLYLFQQMTGEAFGANDDDRTVEATMLGYWSRFAANGDPNGAGAPFWTQYDGSTDPYQMIDVESVGDNLLYEDKCNMWSTLR